MVGSQRDSEFRRSELGDLMGRNFLDRDTAGGGQLTSGGRDDGANGDSEGAAARNVARGNNRAAGQETRLTRRLTGRATATDAREADGERPYRLVAVHTIERCLLRCAACAYLNLPP